MKLLSTAVIALFAASPAFSATSFVVDFEKNWDYANGGVAEYYNGGAAADSSTGGANLGVSFVGVSGLTNDGLGSLPSGNYFENAPSMQGVAYAYDSVASYINVAAGVDSALSFYYASGEAVTGAVKAYSGLNGTGTLLGTFDLGSTGGWNAWQATTFNYAGTAQSFDISATTNIAAFDNISAVPEPTALMLMAMGLTSVMVVRRRRG